MLEDLENEVEAINSIYGDGTLEKAAEAAGVYVLRLPNLDTSLRVQFSDEYPDVPPVVLGTQSAGGHTRKGDAAHVLDVFRDAVGRVFQPGAVCLFDAIEDVSASISDTSHHMEEVEPEPNPSIEPLTEDHKTTAPLSRFEAPQWTLSDVVVERKSVFIARCAHVTSVDQVQHNLSVLLEDKKIASATHNISAYRILDPKSGAVYQDFDDDGETAAGGRVLHLMQLMSLNNVMVVVTRWYGGIHLGPARFGIMNNVARDAFVKAGLVQDGDSSKKKRGS
jgi:hypothetical protein